MGSSQQVKFLVIQVPWSPDHPLALWLLFCQVDPATKGNIKVLTGKTLLGVVKIDIQVKLGLKLFLAMVNSLSDVCLYLYYCKYSLLLLI